MLGEFLGLEAADGVLDDALNIARGDAMIPNVVREHHDVWPLRAQILAAGFAHAHRAGHPQRLDACFQRRRNRFALPVRATDLVRLARVDAHEENFLIRNHAALDLATPPVMGLEFVNDDNGFAQNLVGALARWRISAFNLRTRKLANPPTGFYANTSNANHRNPSPITGIPAS